MLSIIYLFISIGIACSTIKDSERDVGSVDLVKLVASAIELAEYGGQALVEAKQNNNIGWYCLLTVG